MKKCGLRRTLKILTELCLREAAEGYEAKRTREDYGAGSSNDQPHPKRIARLLEIMAHGNSDCEESSEYEECAEELGD